MATNHTIDHTDKVAVSDDLAAVLAAESDAIEANPDAPITSKSTVTRGHGRTKVLQVRFNEAELAELERVAATRGLPPSTVAREAILRQLFPDDARQVEGRRLAAEIRRFVGEFMTEVDAPAPTKKTTTTRHPKTIVESRKRSTKTGRITSGKTTTVRDGEHKVRSR